MLGTTFVEYYHAEDIQGTTHVQFDRAEDILGTTHVQFDRAEDILGTTFVEYYHAEDILGTTHVQFDRAEEILVSWHKRSNDRCFNRGLLYRQQIVESKWNQVTALRFQTWGRQTAASTTTQN